MTAEKLTIIIHPNNIGTQVVYASSREVVMKFTESNDYNANRHATEKWLNEDGYLRVVGSDYEQVN